MAGLRPAGMTAVSQPCPSQVPAVAAKSALHGNSSAAHKLLHVKNRTLLVAARASGVWIDLSLSLVFESICRSVFTFITGCTLECLNPEKDLPSMWHLHCFFVLEVPSFGVRMA